MAGLWLAAGGVFFAAGSMCFVAAGVLAWSQDRQEEQAEEDEEVRPFGFNVIDGATCDGGEPEWEEEY